MENLLLIVVMAGIVGFYVYQHKQYQKTAYYLITRSAYSDVKRDAGKYGEYQIYKKLQSFENEGGKFLFNLYLPTTNGRTNEIDVLLISSKGIFVFESKNYSGWIFGSETHENWTQTLPSRRYGGSIKTRFYNPIAQNAGHIKALKSFVGEAVSIWSIIVFSGECTLKNITVRSADVHVVNLSNVLPVVDEIDDQAPFGALSEAQINNFYHLLYPYTQVDEAIKARHIESAAFRH